MIKPGKYKATFDSMDFGTSKNGNDQIIVHLNIEGTIMSTLLSFSDAAKPYSEDRLIALGWAGKGSPLEPEKLTNEVDVSVSEEMYNGAPQTKVNIITQGGKIVMKDQMSTTQKNDFLKRLTGVSAANGAKKPPVAQKPAVEDDDSIPF